MTFSIFSCKSRIFRFLKIFVIFQFFQFQGSGNLFRGLLVGHCIVSSNNGMVFKILMSRILFFFFWQNLQFFYGFLKFLSVFDIRPFSSARKHIPRSIKKLLHGFKFQAICFQQFNLSTLRSLINFAIFLSCFKIFVFFFHFSCLSSQVTSSRVW